MNRGVSLKANNKGSGANKVKSKQLNWTHLRGIFKLKSETKAGRQIKGVTIHLQSTL